MTTACAKDESTGNTGSPCGAGAVRKPDLREEATGPQRVADGFVVVLTPGNAGRAKGPWFKVSVRSGDSQESGVSLLPPEKVEKLQTALHVKAKRSPDCRFHQLYDKLYRADILWFAHRRCRFNGGAAGVDGVTFDDIEAYGVKRWLDELAEELRNKAYRESPVRRVWIPKPDGKQRPLVFAQSNIPCGATDPFPDPKISPSMAFTLPPNDMEELVLRIELKENPTKISWMIDGLTGSEFETETQNAVWTQTMPEFTINAKNATLSASLGDRIELFTAIRRWDDKTKTWLNKKHTDGVKVFLRSFPDLSQKH